MTPEDIHGEYARKKTTYEQLVRELRSPVSLTTGNSAAKANGIFVALDEHGAHLDEIALGVTNTFEADYPIFSREGVHINTGFYGPIERKAQKNHDNVSYRPVQFCDAKKLLDLGLPGPDVYVICTGPMNEDGFFNLGLSSGLEFASIQRFSEEPNTLVVVEANEHMPHVLGLHEYGGQRFHLSQVDHVIEQHEPVREFEIQPATELDRRMAAHVAELVEDGATVQFGIGALPDTVAECLQSKKDLGVHTEMIGDGCMELIESGAVTNMYKTMHKGLNIATFAWGTQKLYDWIHNNETVRLLPIQHVNGPLVLARQYKMTSMNSILQIDLRGQATAHCINGKTYSGLGGHFEHTYGAQLSEGGKSILCLRSSVDLKTGPTSGVVHQLAPGTAVTTPEFIIDWVVTEHGAVQLKWLTLEERAKALISIADPQFRDELERQAREGGLIPKRG